jgi:hypothetical protein
MVGADKFPRQELGRWSWQDKNICCSRPGPTFWQDSAPFFLVSSLDPLNGAREAKRDLEFWKQDRDGDGDGDEDSGVEGPAIQKLPHIKG